MFKRVDWLLLLIVLLAASLRLWDIGLLPTWIDELAILDPAIRLARHGEWSWLSNQTSFGLLSGHSPFTTYATALPALVYPHPFVMRGFYALLGILTVGLAYAVMRRIVGRPAGYATAALLAVMPLPIYWSRFVWNPSLAPPFLMMWFYTAFIGYERGRKWAQVAHWMCLCFAVQAQSALLLIVPLTSLITLYGLWQDRSHWRDFALRHGAILCLITVTLIPWIIGNYGYAQGWWGVAITAGYTDSGTLEIIQPGIGKIYHAFAKLTASATYFQASLTQSQYAARWWFPTSGHLILGAAALCLGIVAPMLTIWHYRQQSALRAFALLLTISLFWSLGLLLANRPVSDFYMMLTVYASACWFGWLTQMLYRRGQAWIIVPCLFIGLQAWLSLSILNWYHREPQIVPYRAVTSRVADWQSDNHDLLIWEVAPTVSRLEQREWRLHWRILGETSPIRYLTEGTSLPIAPQGQRLAVPDGQVLWFDALLSDIDNHTQYPDRIFRLYDISSQMIPPANYLPSNDTDNFGTEVARVIGAYYDERLDTAETLTFWLYWQPLQSTTETRQFSLRIVDSDGNKLAQQDQLSLSAPLWRAGDTVISQVVITLSQPLPDDWHLELLMYTYPDGVIRGAPIHLFHD